MAEVSRVELVDGSEFDPREWLRRDVLWASLITPYQDQINTFLLDTARYQHDGNVNRIKTNANFSESDTATQAESFFHEGKNVAGLISTVALLNVCRLRVNHNSLSEIIEIQASSIDKVLRLANSVELDESKTEEKAFGECERALTIFARSPSLYGHSRRLIGAGKSMIGFAGIEASRWMSNSLQNEGGTLPVLHVQDGGTSRGSGPNVDMLQSILHSLPESELYANLSVSSGTEEQVKY
jgi:hypothetical protein